MAGLFDLVQREFFQQNDGVIFLHTGGTPALFVYKKKILDLIDIRRSRFDQQ